mmetsp:Transcript_14509/g.31560  ORF Transcript_14509/g.31560 Transcript_14509/m.31560 type:complete len:215 (+) Transcript_14509:127-771(+)
MTPYEQCMIARMFFHWSSCQQTMGLFLGRHRTHIGQLLREWDPKWANVGLDLAILDVTADYLHKEVLDRNLNLGKDKLLYVDSKDWLMEMNANNNAVSKQTFSTKNEEDAFCALTVSMAAGLACETSPPFAARAGERKNIEFLGSLGPEMADVVSWEDIALRDLWKLEDDKFWTALSDTILASEYEEILNQINGYTPMVGRGIIDDGVLITGQP